MNETLASPKDAALKLALEALETIVDAIYINSAQEAAAVVKADGAITAIKAALAQPAQQEPVAYLCENAVGHKYFRWKKPSSTYKPIPLYTTPPQLEERNFCPRCGKRTADLTVIHTCTPPQENT